MAGRDRPIAFSDIVRSSHLWEIDPNGMERALAKHDALLHEHVAKHGGRVVKHTGDGVAAVFPSAAAAVIALSEAQRALRRIAVGDSPLLVRMGVHMGPLRERSDGDVFGSTVNRAARITGVAAGGQLLISSAVAAEVPNAFEVMDLGRVRLRDLEEPEHVHQIVVDGDDGVYPPLVSLDDLDHNLPMLHSTFVGREATIREVGRLLDDSKLVTLVGPGGVGKTRVALELAAQLLHRFDGAFLCDASPVSDLQGLVRVVLSAMRIDAREDVQLTQDSDLDRVLGGHRMLLVFDSCEHLISESVQLIDWILSTAPQSTVLATSRRALGIQGERVRRIAPLSARTEAKELFYDRARASGVVLSEESEEIVEEICRRLDGLPLAIELAAPRLQHMGAAELANHLDHRLRVLRDTSHGRSPRHQTLDAALDWGYQLLSADEQRRLRSCAVFPAGFTATAAALVWGFENEMSALNSLAALIDQSMISVEPRPEGPTRYLLLETVRDFLRQRLTENGELDDAQAAHRRWAISLAQPLRARWRAWLAPPGTPQARYDILQDQRDDVLAALSHYTAIGASTPIARLSPATVPLLLSGVWTDYQRMYLGRRDVAADLAGDDLASYLLVGAINANRTGHFGVQIQLSKASAYAGDVEGSRQIALLVWANGAAVADPPSVKPILEMLERETDDADHLLRAEIHHRRSDMYFMQGCVTEGREELERAAATSGVPDHTEAALGLALHLEGEHAQALEVATWVKDKTPTSYRPYAVAALAHAALGRPDDADAELVQAIGRARRDTVALHVEDMLGFCAASAYLRGDVVRAAELMQIHRSLGGRMRACVSYAMLIHYQRLITEHPVDSVRAGSGDGQIMSDPVKALDMELRRIAARCLD